MRHGKQGPCSTLTMEPRMHHGESADPWRILCWDRIHRQNR